MNRRHVDPRQHEYDAALRTALHMAVEPLEPGADGLDQIRAKIVAKQAERRGFGWSMAGAPRDIRSWWRALLPPRDLFPAVVGAVVERFRPDPNRAGWFGWLRPAAAAMTGLFVVTAASWAVAALPSALGHWGHPQGHPITSTSSKSKERTSKGSHPPYTATTGGGTTPAGHGVQGGGPPGPTPSCTPTASSSPSASSSGSPSASGTPSVSGSPSLSGTPTSTPTSTPSTSPAQASPTGQPTPGATSASPAPAIRSAPVTGPAPVISPVPADSPASPAATGKALLSPDAVAATQLAGALGAGGSTMGVGSGGPVPASTPQPSASPTVGGVPTPTSTPTSPPPC